MTKIYEINEEFVDGTAYFPASVMVADPTGKSNDQFERFDVFQDCIAPESIVAAPETFSFESDTKFNHYVDSILDDLTDMEEAE
ncbi:MAG: hypothetical protein IJU03_00970 [Thermoguttaceae bacterium]|nr:hypothetical protein [Thermoguttaceae bacterium]